MMHQEITSNCQSSIQVYNCGHKCNINYQTIPLVSYTSGKNPIALQDHVLDLYNWGRPVQSIEIKPLNCQLLPFLQIIEKTLTSKVGKWKNIDIKGRPLKKIVFKGFVV